MVYVNYKTWPELQDAVEQVLADRIMMGDLGGVVGGHCFEGVGVGEGLEGEIEKGV